MAKTKVAKKLWYPIVAPKIFRNIALGETIVYNPEKIMGKRLSQNLMTLTNDVKRQNIKIKFEVVKVEDNKAYTEIIGYDMVQSSIKRLVRRNIHKIDMSFTCATSDKKTIRIKPILITRSNASNSVATKIRKNAQEFLVNHISKISYDNFTNDIISHKLQSSLKVVLNKIHPLRICEIRSMYIVKSDNLGSVKEKTPQKEAIKQESKEEAKVEEKKTESVEEVKVLKEKEAVQTA